MGRGGWLSNVGEAYFFFFHNLMGIFFFFFFFAGATAPPSHYVAPPLATNIFSMVLEPNFVLCIKQLSLCSKEVSHVPNTDSPQ